LEKDDEYIVETTDDGGIRRNFRDRATTPEIIDYPVKSKEDWYKIEERLIPDYTRVDWISLMRGYEKAKDEGKFIIFGAPTGYDRFQSFIKTEEMLIAMITEPEWVKRMFKVYSEFVISMVDMIISKGIEFDGAFLYNDMGYKNTSLFSPRTYQELLLETDKKMCDFFHQNNMSVLLHSCGNVKGLIPHLIEAGFDCLQPLEVKAGMDVIELKKEYGDKISFMGGIDVRLMEHPDISKIAEEIKTKVTFAKKGGGYIYHSDHSIPKDVSFERYCKIIEMAREYGKY